MKKGLKLLTSSVAMLLGVCGLSGCVTEVPPAPLVFESITLNDNEVNLHIGDTKNLTATVKANLDTYDEKVQWSSSDATVATVDENGKVTAIKAGDATITAKIGELTATCKIIVTEVLPVYSFVGLSPKKSFTVSKSNKAEQTNKEEQFVELNKPYVVGTENAINVLPNLTIINDDLDDFDNSEGSVEKWNQDFKYTITKVDGDNRVLAATTDYSIVDNRGGKIKFAESAIGNSYEIKVTAGGLSATVEARDSSSVKYNVSVVKGYNVYSAKELGYIDQRHGNGIDVNDWFPGDKEGFCPKWDDFKTANGMDPNYNPDCLVIQDGLKITKDDIPATFFYTEAEAKTANDEKAAGSFRDCCELYTYMGLDGNSTSATDYSRDKVLKIYGNYFSIDFSEFPLVVREHGEKTEVGKVISHSSVFRSQYGSMDFSDLKIRGNSKRATKEDETIYGGGLITFKLCENSKYINTSNVISRQCFITYFGEQPAENNPNMLTFNIKGCKAYDSYNSHIYNYCGVINAENSDFGMCGGPVLIADHGRFSDSTGPETFSTDPMTFNYEVHGNAPISTFKDCTFNNYVEGREAWFTQMGATMLVPAIKSMSDLYAPYGMTYAVDKDHNPLVISTASIDTISMFNFIALNKVSGENLQAVQQPASGSITFINSKKNTNNTYSYAAPNKEAVDDAKVVRDALIAAQAAAPGSEAQQNAIYNLIGLAAQRNITWTDNTNFTDLIANLQAYVESVATRELTAHALLRGANNATAPVMQNGDALVSYNQYTSDPEQKRFLQDISNVATWSTSTPNITPIDNTHKFVTNHSDETALYYSGMMLIIGLNYINA